MCAYLRVEARTICTLIPPKVIESRLLETCIDGSCRAGTRDAPVSIMEPYGRSRSYAWPIAITPLVIATEGRR